MTSLTLTLLESGSLPSQQGKKGRPRKHGRVQIVMTVDTLHRLSPEGCSSPRDNTKSLLPVIAEAFSVQPSDVTFYGHDSYLLSLSFIVKGTDPNTLRTYRLTIS
jgi:hypothetical protein